MHCLPDCYNEVQYLVCDDTTMFIRVDTLAHAFGMTEEDFHDKYSHFGYNPLTFDALQYYRMKYPNQVDILHSCDLVWFKEDVFIVLLGIRDPKIPQKVLDLAVAMEKTLAKLTGDPPRRANPWKITAGSVDFVMKQFWERPSQKLGTDFVSKMLPGVSPVQIEQALEEAVARGLLKKCHLQQLYWLALR